MENNIIDIEFKAERAIKERTYLPKQSSKNRGVHEEDIFYRP